MITGHSGDHRVSGSLLQPMHTPLHMFIVLLCSAYGAFHVACFFVCPHPPPPFFCSITHYLHSTCRFSTVLPVQCDGCQGLGFGGQSGLVAGLQGRLLGVLPTWFWGQQFQPPTFLSNSHPQKRPLPLSDGKISSNW